jgi:single-strand DNA-binding protein
MINNAIIVGNIGSDAEVKPINDNLSVYQFSVAVSKKRRNQQTGETEEKVNWIRCSLFNREGRIDWMANELVRGAKVCVEGELDYHEWTDEQTQQKRSNVGLLAHNVEFMKRSDGQQQGAYQQGAYQQPYQQPQQQAPQQYQQPYAAQAPQQYAQPYAAQPQQQAFEDVPF